jgi:hypothetical protein
VTKFSISRASPWLMSVAVFAAGAAVVLGGKALGVGRNPIGAGVLSAVAFAAATPFVIVWWRRLDEAAREAHKFAWYWGGSAGMVVVAIAFNVLMAPGSNIVTAEFLGADRPRDLVAIGMAAVLLSQVIGYTVAWAGWWIARR